MGLAVRGSPVSAATPAGAGRQRVPSRGVPSLSPPCGPGLAVGLDPQGYGNPDFCWLSLQDTLIWSFVGPIGTVIIVSGVLGDMGSWGALGVSAGGAGGAGRADLTVVRPRPRTQGRRVPVHVHCVQPPGGDVLQAQAGTWAQGLPVLGSPPRGTRDRAQRRSAFEGLLRSTDDRSPDFVLFVSGQYSHFCSVGENFLPKKAPLL